MDFTHWIAPNVGFEALTDPPLHHFFGYYEKCPWDPQEQNVLAMESGFLDRMPTAEDQLALGFIPAGTKRFEKFDTTFAWCWQQGTMLQWLPGKENTVIYNQRAGNRFISIVRDLETGEIRVLPLPIYAISPNGDYALSVNFSRLAHQRPGYGYEGVADPGENEFCPDNDGVYHMDLETGECKLILSLARAADLKRVPSMDGAMQKFNHIQINPQGTRFAVLHRWRPPGGGVRCDRLISANIDGSQPFIVHDHGIFSHYDWVNENQIVAWAEDEVAGRRYLLFDDQSPNKRIIGDGILNYDGHMTISPDREWMLTDRTPPDENRIQELFLWKWPDGPRVDLTKFHAPLAGALRCDLHPRWSRDGRKICIDSAHTGTRQMYVLDVSEILLANLEVN